jgi:hypothetical protein
MERGLTPKLLKPSLASELPLAVETIILIPYQARSFIIWGMDIRTILQKEQYRKTQLQVLCAKTQHPLEQCSLTKIV